MPKVFVYTDAQLATVREHAGTMPDTALGELVGLPEWRVTRLRKTGGLPSTVKGPVWPPERVEKAFQHYVTEGRPSKQVAALLGCTDAAIRKLAARKGWKRAPEVRYINSGYAQRQRNAQRRPTIIAALPPKEERPDADLVAEFLAKNTVTLLEPGLAAGLSAMERQFGTYKPGLDWKAQNAAMYGKKAATR